ncbi:tripartite tricarboxylate transporter TctB family protein [Aeromicrobium sp. CTD01-1L150]|uniref:tripartite tricarboxylate transporter TctB family protein n=1 Tax=Aeromicrobium sp. CTD01-1L150 TaxID=3341830 RepID=UPI0035C12390
MTAGGRPETGVPIELVTSTALLAVGLVYGAQALQEGLGSVAESGPGAFPFAVAVVLVGASAVVIVQERGRSREPVPADEDEDAELDGEVRWGRIAGVLAAALVVPVLGDVVGFVVALSIALGAITKIMGMAGWWRPVVFGVLFGMAVWLVFVHWLYVPLPSGRLGLA